MNKRRWWNGGCVTPVFLAAVAVSRAQTFTTLVNFNVTNGANPTHVSLVQGTDGNFYGTTYYGGAYNYGTIFGMSPDGRLTTLHSFQQSDGAYPIAGVIQGADGTFYGTTYQGGTNGSGNIFAFMPGGALTILHTFTGSDGAYPFGGLVQAANGVFYGTTSNGGAYGFGTVYKLSLIHI